MKGEVSRKLLAAARPAQASMEEKRCMLAAGPVWVKLSESGGCLRIDVSVTALGPHLRKRLLARPPKSIATGFNTVNRTVSNCTAATAMIGKRKRGASKASNAFKRLKPVDEVTFDFNAREDYLTGFHKRKLQRAKHAQEQAAKQEREDRIQQRKEVFLATL